jgi:tetratricopeptide (TPR) repeat protein
MTRDLISYVTSLIDDADTGIKAEGLFQEGKSLYELNQFSSALSKLREAQILFQSINFRNEACAALIEVCEAEMKSDIIQEGAETLLNGGIAYYRDQQYDMAKASFEHALVMFTELQDADKVQQCEQWIASCEEHCSYQENGESHSKLSEMLIGAMILFSGFIVGIVVFIVKRMKKNNYHALEHEKKKLDHMFDEGLISEKEYEIAKTEAEIHLRWLEENQKKK